MLQQGFFRWEATGSLGVASETQEGPRTGRNHEWWLAWQISTVAPVSFASLQNCLSMPLSNARKSEDKQREKKITK
jgi:hypothetical protein